ncbi:MAG: aldehyde ferredoxin oxidoreductase C-terminal domain-containing protein, partial [Desulfatiglandales bacterium]|nr:aldehyde ferredoxin oxidoreductase C-terminal domain-containing protein [Desulfatiglandales bacterium]
DGVIIKGWSDKPVYLFIQDSKVEIKGASFLWGKSTVETQEVLKGLHGKDTKVAAIGPAGENLVSMAIVLADEDSAGSAGFGAVMGSKKVKAIAVKGGGKVVAAHPTKLDELKKYARELRRDAPTIWTAGYHSSFVEENPRFRKVACRGCISGCTRAIYKAEDGKKGKFTCQAPFVYLDNARRYYGKDNDVPFYAARLCDEYGLDITTMVGFIIWLWRCFRAGILTEESTGIPISKLGSFEFIDTLVRKISLRQGFGDILAQGVFQAAETVGGKDLFRGELSDTGIYYAYTPRLYLITGILYATEPRVPIQQLHEVSFLVHEWLEWYNRVDGAFLSTDVLRAIAKRFFGSEIAFDFSTYEGKALAAQIIQNREYAKECLILCDFSWPMRFVRHSANHIGDPTVESQILSAVTGKEIDETGLYQVGERVFNLQRAILVREGHQGRESDALPDSDYTLPLKYERGNPEGLVPGEGGEVISRMGAVVDREKFEKVKDEYYQRRGWDIRSGLQTRTKLEELGLSDVADKLEARGLVVS